MKRRLLGFIAAGLFASVSHADFIFHSNSSSVCADVPGHWTGRGKANNWLIGECKYHGSGIISALDGAGHFKIEVSADKDSGTSLCPKHAYEELTGSCTNGVVTIKTQYGSLAGNFSRNAGDAKGTLSVGPGMSADVVVRFERAG
ncbi:hypothetical protein [Legionella hackeliae]|uniref:Uncharacterized protein n=1 Tax=Legionella hackeliae TaxID=449 RepID=A0A0A8US88_LEGHA|nr:hypothetical protein [Legionella hackeliae]KTD14193.1 hypothetical protein Lhac_0505 [Legionella hackeliae]CEK10401.1 conserved exported protein of unknown function [Legionella hackeliae]STX47138.1 Uncharacterised protein [Legionella hackeliae]